MLNHPFPMLACSTLSQCQLYPWGLSGRQALGKECPQVSLLKAAAFLPSLSLPRSLLAREEWSLCHPGPHRMSQHHFHPPTHDAMSWCSVSTQSLFSCSSPMAFALSTYMNHTGIRSREPRVASTSEKAQALPDKDKWLPFFPKAKKVSGAMAAVPLLCSQLPAPSAMCGWDGRRAVVYCPRCDASIPLGCPSRAAARRRTRMPWKTRSATPS